jgi:DNA-binding transcriptional LysR family regulator
VPSARVICASPDYLARRGVPRKPHKAAFTVEPRPKLAVNTTDAAIQAALAGIGIIRVLSYQVSDQLRSGALQELLAEFAPEPLPVNVLHAADPLPLKVRCFLDWIVPRLRAQMAH